MSQIIEKPVELVTAKDLTLNHKLQISTGDWYKIYSIGKGMFSAPSKMIHLENGSWCTLLDTDKIEAIEIIQIDEECPNTIQE